MAASKDWARPAPFSLALAAAHAKVYGGAWLTERGLFVVSVRRGALLVRRYGAAAVELGADIGTLITPIGKDGRTPVRWRDLFWDAGLELGWEDGRDNRPDRSARLGELLQPARPGDLRHAAVPYRCAYARQQRQKRRSDVYPIASIPRSERAPLAASGLGARLAEQRRQRNLTQQQLADLAGTPQSTIACIENGTRSPSLQLVGRLAEAIGIRAGWIAFGELPVSDEKQK